MPTRGIGLGRDAGSFIALCRNVDERVIFAQFFDDVRRLQAFVDFRCNLQVRFVTSQLPAMRGPAGTVGIGRQATRRARRGPALLRRAAGHQRQAGAQAPDGNQQRTAGEGARLRLTRRNHHWRLLLSRLVQGRAASVTPLRSCATVDQRARGVAGFLERAWSRPAPRGWWHTGRSSRCSVRARPAPPARPGPCRRSQSAERALEPPRPPCRHARPRRTRARPGAADSPSLAARSPWPVRRPCPGCARIGIAAVGADQAIDHQLQRRGRLVPVHRRDDQDPVGGDPARIDLVHPVPACPSAWFG